ncbi:hypothetical protein QUA78_06515 [Microcoleus sp. K4-B3]|uniref:hypothetical protein n=1 Tax=Microcoleus sp. K4-C2 TaxID=2818792 RepID=UPI002FD45502
MLLIYNISHPKLYNKEQQRSQLQILLKHRICTLNCTTAQLSLTLVGEIEENTAIGIRKFRLFKNVGLAVSGREYRYDCVELPAGEKPLLGLIIQEDLG